MSDNLKSKIKGIKGVLDGLQDNELIGQNNRYTEDEKVKKATFTLYPKLIRALEKYAKDNFTNKSQVVTQALIKYIPDEYFD